jgi:hypothetical protein
MSRLPNACAALCALVLASPVGAEERAQGAPAQIPSVQEAPKCLEQAAPPAELAPWTTPRPLTAATAADEAAKAEIKIGTAATVTLFQTPEIKYAARPSKPGGSAAYGGVMRIVVAEAGTYRIAIGNASWVDVVRNGHKFSSVSHGHGPDCSGIRKMVDYALQPGEYVVQLAAGADAQTGVLVVKMP